MRTTDVVIKIIIITVIITLTRDWSRVYAKTISFIEVHKHYTESNIKQQPEEKKLKTVGYIPLTIDSYTMNGQMGDTDPCSDLSC